MGERKIVNKYYPSDFDPSKLPRPKKNQHNKARMMLPMTIRCTTCGNFIYKGTKFNCRKEQVIGENYLGTLQIDRFYSKCTLCSAEFVFKTDLQNSDYTLESGATRNLEPWREEKKRKKEEEDIGMEGLEKRRLDSQREMKIMAALHELKSLKSRHANVTLDSMLEAMQRTKKKKKTEEEDEAIIKSVAFRRRLDDHHSTTPKPAPRSAPSHSKKFLNIKKRSSTTSVLQALSLNYADEDS